MPADAGLEHHETGVIAYATADAGGRPPQRVTLQSLHRSVRLTLAPGRRKYVQRRYAFVLAMLNGVGFPRDWVG